MNLNLGGEERPLDFTKTGVYEHIQEASGKDPFEFIKGLEEKQDTTQVGVLVPLLQDVTVIVYAGLNTALDVQDKENIELKKVKKWCRALSTDDLTPVFKAFFDGISGGKKEGEAEAPATGA